MDEQVVRCLRGTASEVERRRVARWRAASAGNDARYREIEAVWAATELPGSGGAPPAPAASAVIRAAARGTRPGRRAGTPARLAAVLGGLLAAGVAGWLLWPAPEAAAPPTGAIVLEAVDAVEGTGGATTLSLSDGSLVRLAPGASLEPEAADDERVVRVVGRAFFAVREAAEPFVVRMEAAEVRVTGTRFETRDDGAGGRVLVLEGEVEVASARALVTVRAGDVATVGPDGGVRVERPVDPFALLEWEGGLLIFQDTPLARVADELSRHFGRPVRVGDVRVARRPVTAWFDDEPLAEVVDVVCLVAGVSCALGEDAVVLAVAGEGGG